MTPFAATAAMSAIEGDESADVGPAARSCVCGDGTGYNGSGVIITANYSGPSRVLPPLVSQVHPAGLPSGDPAARLRAGGADPIARSVADAGTRGGSAGGAGRTREPPALRAIGYARAHRQAIPDSG